MDLHEVSQSQPSIQPRQITRGEGGKFSPRWRPHRNQLAYILNLDGSENYDIYLFDFETNQHSNLTPRTFYAISPMYAWSPDGNSIAFCADKDGVFRHLTKFLPGNIDLEKFVMPVEIIYSGMDGIDVQGLLYCLRTRKTAHSHYPNKKHKTTTPKNNPHQRRSKLADSNHMGSLSTAHSKQRVGGVSA